MRPIVAVPVLFVLVMLMLAAPAHAQSQTDRQAIQGVIAGQIDAFRHDDGPAAFAYASPDVRQKFQTAEHFLDIVRRGYQPVYRPRSVTYGSTSAEGEHVLQKVEVVGPDGQAYQALYYMLRDAGGVWRIDGCDLTESEAVGA
jgi:hypothetical protein